MRLDKYLADLGKGTRSELREAVRRGRVQVNGTTIKKPETKIRPGQDTVLLDGVPAVFAAMEYYMLNKPGGVVSATEDSRYPTVVELIHEKARRDLFPVGRLDLDTEGLLLITNDGELAHRLLSPKRHVDKTYLARCEGRVPETAIGQFAGGLKLEDGLCCLPARLEILETSDDGSLVRLTIHEGKFHQVKRMLAAVGCPVTELKRLSMGPLTLDPALAPGDSRKLTEEELEQLKRL